MVYLPPAGNRVALRLRSVYLVPAGNVVPLPFGADNDQPFTAQGQSVAASGAFVAPITGAVLSAQGQFAEGAAFIAFPARDWIFSQPRLGYALGTALDLQSRLPWNTGQFTQADPRAAWAPAARLYADGDLAWGDAAAANIDRRAAWDAGDAVQQSESLRWNVLGGDGVQRRLRYDLAASFGGDARLLWLNDAPDARQSMLRWAQAQGLSRAFWLALSRAGALDRQSRLPWGLARVPDWVYLITPQRPEPPAPPACYTAPLGNRVELRFLGDYAPPPGNAAPVPFSCRVERRFDIRRTLNLSHSLSVVRLPDRLALHVTAVSMALDRDSWTWAVSLTFADASSSIAVEPTPAATQDVEITLDGYVWVATVESVTEDRALNQRKCSATGRSRTALQAQPYQPQRAYTNPAPATAQQLAQRELDFSGFTIDWQIADWTVPAGAWAYSLETPISAITKIAQAAGAMIQSAPDSDTIVIKPRTPVAPWTFSGETPDFTLAGGSWLKKGKRYASGGRYNGAVVTGQQQGVNVIVYRDGTSGSPYAQQIVDSLITDTVPAVARGTQIVADSLDRHEIPIELPLMPSPAAPGLLLPGELGEIEDTVWGTYRAVVDAVTISADVSTAGLITARQNATLWRYLTP